MEINVNGLLNGLMIYWDEVNEAARYIVHLLINDKEICQVETDRLTKYYSFTNLAKIDQGEPYNESCFGRVNHCSGKTTGKYYFVYVEAEDRNGVIISRSEKRDGDIYILRNGSYSLKN